jgi:hypothetical protein
VTRETDVHATERREGENKQAAPTSSLGSGGFTLCCRECSLVCHSSCVGHSPLIHPLHTMSSDSGNASPAGGSVVAAAAASSPVAAAAASSFSSPSPSPPPSASPSSVVLAVFSEPRASAQAAAETAREEASHPQKEEELLWSVGLASARGNDGRPHTAIHADLPPTVCAGYCAVRA